MKKTITNQNLFAILPSTIARVIAIISEKEHISLMAALKAFYHSESYKMLEKEETKYWQMGPVAIYEDFAKK